MSDNDDEVQGGEGAARPHRGDLANLRLLRRAMKAGWAVSPSLKRLAVEQMGGILRAGKSPRAMVAASRALVSMNKAELDAVETAVKVRQAVELEERLLELEKWAAQAAANALPQRTEIQHEYIEPPATDESGNPMEP